MPIYSETLHDDRLIKLITPDTNNVYIIGCGACENESLAYTYDLPITTNVVPGQETPFATATELVRLKTLLSHYCPIVETKHFNDINGFICMNDVHDNKYDITPINEPDLIFALCCDAGFNAIKDLFPNSRVVKITKQTGMIYYSFSDNTGSRVIDKTKSGVIPIKFSES